MLVYWPSRLPPHGDEIRISIEISCCCRWHYTILSHKASTSFYTFVHLRHRPSSPSTPGFKPRSLAEQIWPPPIACPLMLTTLLTFGMENSNQFWYQQMEVYLIYVDSPSLCHHINSCHHPKIHISMKSISTQSPSEEFFA